MTEVWAVIGLYFPFYAIGFGILGIAASISAPTFGGRLSRDRVRLAARLLAFGAFALLIGYLCVLPLLYDPQLSRDPAYLAARLPEDGRIAAGLLVLVLGISGAVLFSGRPLES